MKNDAYSTRASQNYLESAKEALDQAYTEALESCIQTKMEELDNLHHAYKRAASWELLREITNHTIYTSDHLEEVTLSRAIA